MKHLFHQLSSARLIALGFAAVILIGSVLLILPCSVQDGVQLNYIDSLYTSTSAVCVTGLIAVDAGDTFTPLGQFFLAMLIQVGGLGVTAVGAGVILAMGKRVDMKGRNLIRDAMNLDSGRGVIRFVKSVFLTTLIFELSGAILSFIVFVQDYPPLKAIGISLFHSVAAFNNSGFDILGNFQNLIPYRDNVLLNLVTCGLIFFGGIGFLVILDVLKQRSFKKLMLHSKVVITTSLFLIVSGTLLLKATENITWLGAFFQSVSARTAGFSTYAIGDFTDAGLFVLILLMFIGASPGSTGGGIKTSTFFVVIQNVRSIFAKRPLSSFRRNISPENLSKAYIVTLLSLGVVCIATFLMCVLEPECTFIQLLFEVVSAFGTVGLSTGITPGLSWAGKLVIILVMYTGRIGAFTLVSMWIEHPEPNARYTTEAVTIG